MRDSVGLRGRRLIVEARIDVGSRTLCVIVDDGEIFHIAVNSRFAEFAIRHAVAHAQRGIDDVQLCAVDCPG